MSLPFGTWLFLVAVLTRQAARHTQAAAGQRTESYRSHAPNQGHHICKRSITLGSEWSFDPKLEICLSEGYA